MQAVECELARLLINESGQVQMVMLREKDGPRSVPIMIGIVEAVAISRRLSDEDLPRPMTHDLFRNTLDRLGVVLERVTVTDIRDETFFALLSLRTAAGEAVEVDARPSDALALAVRVGCPVFVAEHVLDAVSGEPE